jgi:hypothetical protein
MKSQTPGRRAEARETACLQARCTPRPSPAFCLPCRRSWVRIPSAALGKACICRPFLWAQSACASASCRTDAGLAPTRSSAVPRNPLLAGPFWFVRTQVPLRACRRSSVLTAAAVSPTLAAVARSCGQRPTARDQGGGSWGASPVSVRKPRGQPRPVPRLGERCPAEPCAFSQDGVRGSRAVLITGACVVGVTRGSSPRVSLPSATRRSARSWAGLLVVVRCGGRLDAAQSTPFRRREAGLASVAARRPAPQAPAGPRRTDGG